MLLTTISLYLTLAACGLLGIALILKYNFYRREPWWAVLLTLALGAAAMFAAGWTQEKSVEFLVVRAGMPGNVALAAAASTTEELAKFMTVILTTFLVGRHFDTAIDGILYGSLAGLGAAVYESVHLLGWHPETHSLPPQEPIRLAGHIIMGGISCYGIGLLATRRDGYATWGLGFALLLTLAGLVGGISLHWAWDAVAFHAADAFEATGVLRPWHTIAPVAMMIAGMLTYRALVEFSARRARRQLGVCDVATRRC